MPVARGSKVAQWTNAAGFTGYRLIIMVAIARAESGWNTSAHALTPHEDSRGLYQINVRAHPWGRRVNLYHGDVNARAARRVFLEAGGSFNPWSVWLHCTMAPHLDDAIQAVRDYGIGGGRRAEHEAITFVSKHCQLPDIKTGGTATEWTRRMLERTALDAAHEGMIKHATRGLGRSRRTVRRYSDATWEIIGRRIGR